MFQEFFTDTIESKFIKNILYNTPLPIIDSVTESDYLISGICYIYGRNIIKCTKSGILYRFLTEEQDDACEYELVGEYQFGDDVPKLTERFKSTVGYYDSETHMYLGKYLRCIRDIYNIDLLPFYNCFNYKVVPDLYLSKTIDQSTNLNIVLSSNEQYKIVSVPIRFNKTYTIAIDCSTEVLLKSVIYGKYGLIRNSKDEFSYLTNYLKEDSQKSFNNNGGIIKVDSMRFTSPIEYKIENNTNLYDEETSKKLQQNEKYLYLLIQLPNTNKSSISVIETDRINKSNEIVNVPYWISTSTEKEANDMLLSNLSLLQFNSKTSYAFSDRLIENLLLNVINQHDPIERNIIRVQRYAALSDAVSHEWGIFSRYDRYVLYNKYMSKPELRKIDITGYVDKDMERLITRGLDV